MYDRFKATCRRVRGNNGLVEVLVVRLDDGSPQSQEWPALFNLPVTYGEFEEGKDYWVQIQPAFPY